MRPRETSQTVLLAGLAKYRDQAQSWLAAAGGGPASPTPAAATMGTLDGTTGLPAAAASEAPPGAAPGPGRSPARTFRAPNLTQPKPPKVPEPERIELASFAKEVGKAASLRPPVSWWSS